MTFIELCSHFKRTLIQDGVYQDRRWRSPAGLEMRSLMELADFGDLRTHKEKIFGLLNNTTSRPKCHCGNFTSLISTQRGFNRFCSKKCSAVSDSTKKNRAATNIEKYGAENVFASSKIKNKIKKTVQERYGVNHVSQSDKVRQKVETTLKSRYGGDNPMHSPAAISKLKATNLQRYGTEWSISSKSVREKTASTCTRKYGVDAALKSSAIRSVLQTRMLTKYGVEHNSKLPEVVLARKTKIKDAYIISTLPARLNSLAELNIFPVGWTIDQYTSQDELYKFVHRECGTHFIAAFKDGRVPNCPTCVTTNRSRIESALYARLAVRFPQAKRNDRSLIKPKEIDILIDNIGIEVNGVYWHSEDRTATPILNKTELFMAAGGKQLLHLWDYELSNKFDLCVSMIENRLGVSKLVHARKCKIVILNNVQSRMFLDENHLQGNCPAHTKLGLMHEGEIVMALTIRKSMFSKHADNEIARLAAKKFTHVVGGASRLFEHAKKLFPSSTFVSYADRRYSHGAVYDALGFTRVGVTPPNYFWVKGTEIVTRYKSQKHKIAKYSSSTDLSESQIMKGLGYLKIRDCGSYVYIFSP